jgi:hypothetical protein
VGFGNVLSLMLYEMLNDYRCLLSCVAAFNDFYEFLRNDEKP